MNACETFEVLNTFYAGRVSAGSTSITSKYHSFPDAFSEPWKTSMMEPFPKIVNG